LSLYGEGESPFVGLSQEEDRACPSCPSCPLKELSFLMSSFSVDAWYSSVGRHSSMTSPSLPPPIPLRRSSERLEHQRRERSHRDSFEATPPSSREASLTLPARRRPSPGLSPPAASPAVEGSSKSARSAPHSPSLFFKCGCMQIFLVLCFFLLPEKNLFKITLFFWLLIFFC